MPIAQVAEEQKEVAEEHVEEASQNMENGTLNEETETPSDTASETEGAAEIGGHVWKGKKMKCLELGLVFFLGNPGKWSGSENSWNKT